MVFFKPNFSPSFIYLTPTYGFKGIKVKGDNVVFFGGGCNEFKKDVILYNISKNSYQRFSLNNSNIISDSEDFFLDDQFSGLAAFDMVYIEKEEKILIFGGMDETKTFSDTLFVLENYAELKIIQTVGDFPSPRIGHTFTKINDTQIILFGGAENVSRIPDEQIIPRFLNDLYILHIDNEDYYRWVKIDTSAQIQPCPRESHTSIFYDNQLIIFGGMDGFKRLNDVWTLDVKSFEWTKAITSGVQPIARSMHSANLVDDKMYIFGGFIHSDKYSLNDWQCTNSIQWLDLETMKWKNVSLIEKPDPRAGHVAIEHYGRIYIWSGRDDEDFDEALPIKCHNDVWCFESKKPSKVTNLTLLSYEKESFKIEWSACINAIYYVVELKEIKNEIKPVIKPEPMIVDDEIEFFIEEHPVNIVVAKPEKPKSPENKKPKIIIHEDILLTPPYTINTDKLLKKSETYEILKVLPSDVTISRKSITPIFEQLDGTSDLYESTDSEMETSLVTETKKNVVKHNCWYLVGIFKNNSCNVKNFTTHLINRTSVTSDSIPILIGSKQISLEPGKTYLVRVSGLNSCGLSETSDVLKIKMKDNEPINNMCMESHDDFYALKWNTTLENVDFLVSFEINVENYSKTVTIYKGRECQCKISKHLYDKTSASDKFTIYIRAISPNGQIIHGTELRYTSDNEELEKS